MGDTENTLPPSKKRAAGRELSRDNPGLDDEEEDVLDQQTGTFKKASEEVLANRRIVKVRRKTTSTPSSNPFASIQLIPPTNPTPVIPTNVQEPEKTPSEVAEIDNPKKETEKEEKEEEAKDDSKKETEKEEDECETKQEAETVSKKDENGEKRNSFGSFQHLSSSQNAFTGLIGTGFSSSSFSFGSLSKNDNNTTFPSFGTNGNNVNDKIEIKKPSMQEVEVQTGEENENAVFTSDSVLFEFLDGGWKERGKGELKVNVSTSGIGIGKARLVMRARGNYRLILNASIFPDMKLTNMEKKGITFACVNSTGEGQNGLSTFALKFKDSSIVEEFRAVVTQHKGDNIGTHVSSLKTPENSPKGSDEYV